MTLAAEFLNRHKQTDQLPAVAKPVMVDFVGRGVVASAQKVDLWKNLTTA